MIPVLIGQTPRLSSDDLPPVLAPLATRQYIRLDHTDFNIGNQTAGVVNNVAGDQYVSGGQHGSAVATDTARRAVDALRAALAAARLDEHTAVAAHAHVSQLEEAMRAPKPDRDRVAGALGRLTAILRSAGSLVTAGATLVGPIHTLASWLGAVGDPILRMLPSS